MEAARYRGRRPICKRRGRSSPLGHSYAVGMAVSDAPGSSNLTGSPLLITGITVNGLALAGNYYSPINADATMLFRTLTTIVPGEYIQNSTATTPITNPVKVVSYGSGAIGLLGNYTLSGSSPQRDPGRSWIGPASPVVFTLGSGRLRTAAPSRQGRR